MRTQNRESRRWWAVVSGRLFASLHIYVEMPRSSKEVHATVNHDHDDDDDDDDDDE